MSSISHIREIRPLNQNERSAIGKALQFYIAQNGEKKASVQKIILEEMLYELMWAALKEQP